MKYGQMILLLVAGGGGPFAPLLGLVERCFLDLPLEPPLLDRAGVGFRFFADAGLPRF